MVRSHQRHGKTPAGGPAKWTRSLQPREKKAAEKGGREEPITAWWSGENDCGANHSVSFPTEVVAGDGRFRRNRMSCIVSPQRVKLETPRNRTMVVVKLCTVLDSE